MSVEKYGAICHRRHGWIEAPQGGFFALSKSGKSYELHETEPLNTSSHYPFGTRWNATSITAVDLLA